MGDCISDYHYVSHGQRSGGQFDDEKRQPDSVEGEDTVLLTSTGLLALEDDDSEGDRGCREGCRRGAEQQPQEVGEAQLPFRHGDDDDRAQDEDCSPSVPDQGGASLVVQAAEALSDDDAESFHYYRASDNEAQAIELVAVEHRGD